MEYSKIEILKIAGPHILILTIVTLYIVLGGVIFLHLEIGNVESPIESEALALISGAFNDTNITDELMYTCTDADVEVLFDALYHGCCPASAQLNDECFSALKDELMQCLELMKNASRRVIMDVPGKQSATAKWDYTSAIVLAFTIVTTIGYGHIAPSTVGGRVFCVFYGLLGIPLTLLAIADHGRFLSAGISFLYSKFKLIVDKIKKPKEDDETRDEEHDEDEEEDEEEELLSPFLLIVIYVVYLFVGSVLLVKWQEDWTFMDAMYFSFVSLSTIGFGDVVPTNYKYLPFVLLYIGVGLVLSSVAIDILAEYLRKLHEFGKKIRNVRMQKIWFGGKQLTVKDLVSSVGKYLGADEATLAQLVENLDVVVIQCIEEKETGIVAEPPIIITPRQEEIDHIKFEESEITKEPLTPKPPTPKQESPKQSFFSEVGFIDDRDEEE